MASEVNANDERDWDDSALIDSWDSALAEYKVSSHDKHSRHHLSDTYLTSLQKYHSIQAQGKRLEDVLTKDEVETLREYSAPSSSSS